MVGQPGRSRFKPWRLVCVDFPGGKTWGFDQLEVAAGGPVGVVTAPQELRSPPCANIAAAIADTVPHNGAALAVVGHCTTFGLVCGVVRALRQRGSAPVGLVVDPQPVTAANLADELRSASATLCGDHSNVFGPAAMTPAALDSWIDDATALLRAGVAENTALSSLSATTREQFVERYRYWFAHLAASSLGETVDAVATFPDASAASRLLEDVFVVAFTERSGSSGCG